MKRFILVLALPIDLFVKLISFGGVDGGGGGETNLLNNSLARSCGHSSLTSNISDDFKDSISYKDERRNSRGLFAEF